MCDMSVLDSFSHIHILRICLALNAASDAYEPGMTIANVLSRIDLLRASRLNL